MQFNMYHHYTVDEHLLRTVGELTRRSRTASSPTSCRCRRELIKSIQNRRALYVAAFLHDIGKGRKEDHSIVGARIARKLCPRLGLTPAETDTVAWLIEQHLTMSNIAQSRDLSDPKTIRDFADIVQSAGAAEAAAAADRRRHPRRRARHLERLEGPAAAHALLRDRAAGRRRPHADRPQASASARRRRRCAAALADWPAARRRALHRAPLSRLLAEDRDHASRSSTPRLVRRAEAEGEKLATAFTTDAFTGDHRADRARAEPSAPAGAVRRLPARRPAPTSSARTSRRRATASRSTRSCCNASSPTTTTRAAAPTRIGETIDTRAEGRGAAVERCWPSGAPSERRLQAFTVEPEVMINNALSDSFTVIEVVGPRPTGPALRADQHAVGSVARHHVGAHHDLRREGGRRVLRHRPDRQEDRSGEPAADDSRPAGEGAGATGGRIGSAALTSAVLLSGGTRGVVSRQAKRRRARGKSAR